MPQAAPALAHWRLCAKARPALPSSVTFNLMAQITFHSVVFSRSSASAVKRSMLKQKGLARACSR